MNLAGAEKCADYLGQFLSSKYGLENLHDDKETAGVWKQKAEFYHSMEKAQYEELEEYGK